MVSTRGLKSTVAGNNPPPFRARMEAQGEDSDGLDYESPVEPEQTTRAVASSGSPSRQILRDAPKAVPDRAPRGKHDRRAARRRPIQAPASTSTTERHNQPA